MSRVDSVFGLDWEEAEHIGYGVHLLDSTHHTGIPSVALRTDRTGDDPYVPKSFVIVLEKEVFDKLVRLGQAIISRQQETIRGGPA